MALLALLAPRAEAQGSRKDDIVFGPGGHPVAGATVTVCQASATGTPCAPLATLYTDATLTVSAANPLQTDGIGNYHFYAAPGRYVVQISGPGITGTLTYRDVILAPDVSSSSAGNNISAFGMTLGGNLSVAGNAAVNGTLAVGGSTTFSAPLSINAANTGNVAGKPGSADAVQYVTPEGNDSNDGLSWGTAKLTMAGACAALPGGNASCSAGSGTIFAPPNASVSLPAGTASTISLIYYTPSGEAHGGPRPWIDVTAYGASGSAQTSTANCASGVASLTLTGGAADFKNGQGISLLNCGSLPSVTPPAIAGIAQVGAAGSTTYSYGVACVDALGGNSGWGSLVNTTTGNATLSGTSYNAIYMTPEANCRGYVLIGRTAGSPIALQYMPWEESSATTYTGIAASRSSNYDTLTIGSTTPILPTWYVTVTNCSDTTFNGTWQAQFVGQTIIQYQHVATNSTATGCTVVINPTFFDFGTTFPMLSNTGITVASTAQRQIFTTTITSGGGTTTLNLASAPSVSLSSQTVRHDDTTAWQNAINAANTTLATSVHCPMGRFYLTGDLSIPNVNTTILGETGLSAYPGGGCAINQLNPGADIFRVSTSVATLKGLYLAGGRIGIDYVPSSPSGILNLDDIDLLGHIGFRSSYNSIQIHMRNLYCETSDWCIDSSPASTIQDMTVDGNCWFAGVGNGTWHDIRVPNTYGYSSAFSFRNCLWEGPIGSWMVASNTPVGARNIFGDVAGLVFDNPHLADSGTSNVPWLQTMPSTNGSPVSIHFIGGYMAGDSAANTINVLSNGTSQGPTIIFDGGVWSGSAAIVGFSGSTPAIYARGGSYTPALLSNRLVYMNSAGKLGLGTNAPAYLLDMNGPMSLEEGTAPSGAAGNDVCYGDSTAHAVKCSWNNGSFLNVPQVIASGTAALGTTAISATSCATVVTTAATGVATTDAIGWSFNAAPGTGYTAGLYVLPYVTSGNVNFLVCNPTAGSLTPAAATLNWRVLR